MPTHPIHPLERFARERRRVSLLLSAVIVVSYFSFILLAAYAKQFMGTVIIPGLSWGILLGAVQIAIAFALTGIYVRWANAAEGRLKDASPGDGGAS